MAFICISEANTCSGSVQVSASRWLLYHSPSLTISYDICLAIGKHLRPTVAPVATLAPRGEWGLSWIAHLITSKSCLSSPTLSLSRALSLSSYMQASLSVLFNWNAFLLHALLLFLRVLHLIKQLNILSTRRWRWLNESFECRKLQEPEPQIMCGPMQPLTQPPSHHPLAFTVHIIMQHLGPTLDVKLTA